MQPSSKAGRSFDTFAQAAAEPQSAASSLVSEPCHSLVERSTDPVSGEYATISVIALVLVLGVAVGRLIVAAVLYVLRSSKRDEKGREREAEMEATQVAPQECSRTGEVE